MSGTDNEIRIYRGSAPTHVEVEGLDGAYPLIHHSDTDFAWGHGHESPGPTNLAKSIVIDTLGRDARCKRCSGGGIDPDSGREAAICRDCGGDGWSDIVALAVPVVLHELVASLEQGAPFRLTSEQVMDIILRVSLQTP